MEKLYIECFLWAWMTLHPDHLIKLLIKAILLGILILAPLLVLNGQLIKRGIQPQLPSSQLQLNNGRETH